MTDLIGPITDLHHSNRCFLKVFASSDKNNKDVWYLGHPFLNKYTFVFNRTSDNKNYLSFSYKDYEMEILKTYHSRSVEVWNEWTSLILVYSLGTLLVIVAVSDLIYALYKRNEAKGYSSNLSKYVGLM